MQFTPTCRLGANPRTGSQLGARALVELDALLVAIRALFDDVVEPIESTFLEIYGRPGGEREAVRRGGQKS